MKNTKNKKKNTSKSKPAVVTDASPLKFERVQFDEYKITPLLNIVSIRTHDGTRRVEVQVFDGVKGLWICQSIPQPMAREMAMLILKLTA